MATAEMAGVYVDQDEGGGVRVIFPANGLRLNKSGVDVANLLRKPAQPELSFGSPAVLSGIESQETIILALVNGVKLRIFPEDDYFL